MIKSTLYTIIFLLFVFPAVMALFIRMYPSGSQPGYSGSKRVSIYGEKVFTQEFVSLDKNLSAVGTSIKNPNLKNKKDIIFNLYDYDNNLIRTVIVNGFNIGDGDFMRFIFEKIPNSKNQNYKFSIASPTAGQEEIIELFLIKPTAEILNYTYTGGDNPEVHTGGVPMVTYFKPDTRFEIVKKIYSNLFSKLWTN